MVKCNVDDCTTKVKAKGMCKRHYDAFMKREKRGGGYLREGDFCRKGHKIEGDNVQRYLNHGIERVRCVMCNKSTNNNNALKLGDICLYGHKIEGDNATWIKDPDNPDIKRVRCRQCTKDRHKRYHEKHKLEPEYRERIKIQMEREKFRKQESLQRALRHDKILEVEVKQGSGSYTGLNYLKLNKRAQRAWEPLEHMFDKTRSFCYKNPAEYIDYDDDNIPTKSHAFQLCNGCPMLVECGRFANAYKPVIGVWAGEVWLDGRVIGK